MFLDAPCVLATVKRDLIRTGARDTRQSVDIRLLGTRKLQNLAVTSDVFVVASENHDVIM